MEYKTKAQQECYERILPMMKELFGEFALLADDQPAMAVEVGSAFVGIRVIPWGPNDAMIVSRSYVVTGAEICPDLMQFLLRKNGSMMIGAFGLDDDNNIVLDYTLMGLTCDKPELKAAVLGVLKTADDLDDEIVAKWGGQRAIDRRARP